jgi:ribose transport system permease protein
MILNSFDYRGRDMSVTNKELIKKLFPFIGLAAVIVLFTAATGGGLLATGNMVFIFNQSFIVMIVAAGATLIYAHGGIDFSLGAVLALSQMCAVLLYRTTGMAWILIPTCILVAVGCGFITGISTIKLRLPPFIASLCVQFAGYGVINTVLNVQVVGVPHLATPQWDSMLPVLIAVIAVMAVILTYTKVGKYNKAIGENITAAKTSGINTDMYRLLAYLICGFMLGIAAYFDLLRNGVMSPLTGRGLELNVIIALVLGGMSLSGGYSASVRCAVIGSLAVVIIQNGLILLGLRVHYIGIVQGVIFLAVVIFTYKRNKSVLLPR